MALSWSSRRKFIYLSVVGLFGVLVLWGVYNTFFSTPPTCFDGRRNGGEQGADCGGPCALLCTNQAGQPTAAWARAFLTAPGIYTAAAYLQNPNVGAAARNVQYSFQIYDTDNHLIIEKEGAMDIPPFSVVPVVETNINVGSRIPARTLFSFVELPTWRQIPQDVIPRLTVGGQQLSADGTRLSLVVTNDTVEDTKNVTVVGVLFDAQGVALAASKSLISALPHKSSQSVVLTWPLGNPGVVRAEITVLPSF